MQQNLNIFKDKCPDCISFIRNEDGSYMATWTGIVEVNRNLFADAEIRVPKCKLEWDKNSFLPMPVIEEAEIILIKTSNDKYSLCPKVTEIGYPRCINLRQHKYCTKKICS